MSYLQRKYTVFFCTKKWCHLLLFPLLFSSPACKKTAKRSRKRDGGGGGRGEKKKDVRSFFPVIFFLRCHAMRRRPLASWPSPPPTQRTKRGGEGEGANESPSSLSLPAACRQVLIAWCINVGLIHFDYSGVFSYGAARWAIGCVLPHLTARRFHVTWGPIFRGALYNP